MMTPGETPLIPAMHRNLWVIWIALLLGVLVFAGIVLGHLASDGALDQGVLLRGDARSDAAPIIATILGTASISVAGMSFVVPALLGRSRPAAREGGNVKEALREALVAFQRCALVGWAMAEGGGLLAVVGVLLVGTKGILIAGFGLFFVSMLLAAPTSSRLSSFLQDRLMDRGLPLAEVEGELANL